MYQFWQRKVSNAHVSEHSLIWDVSVNESKGSWVTKTAPRRDLSSFLGDTERQAMMAFEEARRKSHPGYHTKEKGLNLVEG